MGILVLIGQIVVLSAGPPLRPEDAVRVLRSASGVYEIKPGQTPLEELPLVLSVFPARPKAEPYGALGPREPLVREIPGITYGLPHGWWKTPRTASEEAPRRDTHHNRDRR